MGGDVENTQKIHRSHRNHIKYKGVPLNKIKCLREMGWGWMGVINHIKDIYILEVGIDYFF